MVQRYDLVALPVVDADDRLVGVITVDDVLDIVEEEATEDILKLAGVGVKERALSPVFESARRRLPWLIVNMVVGSRAAFIVSRFEDTIAQVAGACRPHADHRRPGRQRRRPDGDDRRARPRARRDRRRRPRRACSARRWRSAA